LNVFPATQLQKIGIAILVFAVTSHTFWTTVLSANVGQSSTNKLLLATTSSHKRYVSTSFNDSGVSVALSINQLATLPLAFNTGNLFSSPAPLDVFTNTVVSLVSTSRSNVSLSAGLIILFDSPSPAVSLLFNTAGVVSFTLILTLVSAQPALAKVESVTAGLLQSLKVKSVQELAV